MYEEETIMQKFTTEITATESAIVNVVVTDSASSYDQLINTICTEDKSVTYIKGEVELRTI